MAGAMQKFAMQADTGVSDDAHAIAFPCADEFLRVNAFNRRARTV